MTMPPLPSRPRSEPQVPAPGGHGGRADKKLTERILKAFHEEERFGKAYDARLTKRLWGYLKPYRLLLLASVVGIVLSSASSLVRRLIMPSAIDGWVRDG